MNRVLFVLLLAAMMVVAGCDAYTAKTVQTFDVNATAARNIANDAAAGKTTPEEAAYRLECFARTFENLSAAGHWKPAVWAGPPTNKPTTLPWKPEGGKQ